MSDPTVVADGAHSPDSARCLRETLTEYLSCEEVFLIVGMTADKDVDGLARELAPIARRVVAVRSHHPRAMAPGRVAAAFSRAGVEAEASEDVATGLEKAMAAADLNGVLCLTGSLFVAAEGRAHLGRTTVAG